MLFKVATLERILSGEVTLAFRRWTRPQARQGSRMRTAVGVIEVTSLAEVDEIRITEEDAFRAGHASREALLEELGLREGTTYRIGLRFAGEDPRVRLRESADLTDEDIAGVRRRLERMDRRATGPWTVHVLELIERRPGTRAAELAAETGRETQRFKTDVRKLKDLGLTESLETGYRLSPRGEALLRQLRAP